MRMPKRAEITIEKAVLLFENQASGGCITTTDVETCVQHPGDQSAAGSDRVEERETISESSREDENDPDAEDGSEVAGATELTEPTPFFSALGELEPNRPLDGKNDVVAEGPDDDEDDQGRVSWGEIAETDSAEGREQHRRRRHLGLAEDGEHGPCNEHDQKAGELSRKLEPTACFGTEMMDLGKIVVEGGGEDA